MDGNNSGDVNKTNRGLISRIPADRWEEALVTGNGTMGALVFGQPYEETIILNHEKLYEPFHEEIVQNKPLAPYLPEIREMMKRGKFQDAAALFSDKSGHPLLFTDAYHPAYALKWKTTRKEDIDNYARKVDFESGEIKVYWESHAGGQERNVVISRAHDVIALQIKTNGKDRVNGEISIDDLVHEGSGIFKIHADKQFLSFSCKYTKTNKGYVGSSYIILKNGEGTVKVEEEKLVIKDTAEVLILTKICPVDDYNQESGKKMRTLQRSLLSHADLSYGDILSNHQLIHGEMFNRMTFTIGEQDRASLTTEDLLATKTDGLDPILLQQMFDMGRYVFLCSSGEYPPNLVGLWTGDWRPPWSGDFTTDANVNLAVSGGGIGNMGEALEGYFHLIEKISPDWKVNAKTMFGCRGFLAGSRTDGNHNIHTHFNEDWPLGFWTAGAQWLVMPFYEWYQITGDREFFKKRVLPLMKEISFFYEDFLTEQDEFGKTMFVPSYSPENTPNISEELLKKGWQPSQATINATMDLAVTKELLINLINTCDELGIEEVSICNWIEMLNKIPEYMINEDGALKEWAHKDLNDEYDHRHISHLYPVWPGHEITPEKTPELFEAAKRALMLRKRGNYSAHGIMHCGIVAARLKEKALVQENIKLLLHEGDYIHSSLVTSHNPGRVIYNVDANCSFPTLVMEMLVYSVPGMIELLPALPDDLLKGSITGMLTRTEVTIEQLEWNMEEKKINVSIRSRKNQQLDLLIRNGMKKVTCNDNNKVEQLDANVLFIEMQQNAPLKLEIELT
ncbi:glycoside hydrolase N-terminal domain-containing protein [Evansella sp. AB-rgal1]|uniref:glycosyl hydrolase family 95 catalytic domain-containing protein n=1 Tax=Evansella sp. AB-rgal1 TaxID=3242696 RepID=UPI00359DA082